MDLLKLTMFNFAVLFLFLQIVPITIEAKSKYTDEDKPYEFGFNIEGQQHRREKKDENGIIMGEFGFITADGVYHVTVYATDAEGNFKIISMKNIRLGAAPDVTPRPLLVLTSTLPPVPNYQDNPANVQYNSPSIARPIVLTIPAAAPVASCSHCSIPAPPPPANLQPNYNQQEPSIDLQTPFDKPQNPSYGNDQFQPQNPNYQQSPDYQQDPGNAQYQNQNQLNDQQTGPSTQGPAYSAVSNNPDFNPVLISAVMRPVNLEDIPTTTGPGENPGLPNGITEPDMLDLLYRFNYTVGFHGHHEEGYTNGVKKGEYYVNSRNGFATKVSYTADSTGFHPKIETVRLADADTPREETEKNDEYGLKGYDFEWFYVPKYHYLNQK